MISNAGRDLIIDVLHHAATGGNVPVPEKHFDPKIGSRVTFHRHSPLTPAEMLQRLFEGLGFPPDLVTQYLTDMHQASSFPTFSTVGELLEENGECQSFLIQSCFDLFHCMTWFTRDTTEEVEDMTPEAADEVLESEVEAVLGLFGDNFIGRRHFDDSDSADRELYFSFETSSGHHGKMEGEEEQAEKRRILVVVRLPDYYPMEPPVIFLQPLRGTFLNTNGGDDAVPALQVGPSCTKDITAVHRRLVMDAAVIAINGFVGGGCLLGLISAIHGAISSIEDEATVIQAAPSQKEREAALNKREESQQQRRAFLGALQEIHGAEKGTSGGAQHHTRKTDGGRDEETRRRLPSHHPDAEEDEDRFIQVSMPAKVEMDTVSADAIVREARREFLTRDAERDVALQQSWEKLNREGSLRQTRKQLPAYRVREQLRAALREHSVVVIGGETGSGKTTQVPQYLYEYLCEEGCGSTANIVCTQPRRLAATSVALRVAEERDEAAGGTVGYSIRLENCVSRQTQITYCTTGIVLRRLQTDKFLGRVSHVVVDEIHERGVDTDFLLILLRDLVRRRTDLKVVLMSATMDSELFARYFDDAPVISIAGRTFPVTVMHLETIIPTVNYTLEDGSPYERVSVGDRETRRRNTRKAFIALDLDDVEEDAEQARAQQALAKVVQGSPQTLDIIARMNTDLINYELVESIVQYVDTQLRIPGAILIFLPGMAEILRCMEQLKFNTRLSKSCIFYNLHSSLGSAEQQGVFQRPPPGKRKVILGTNIMETSITIDDAVFVIDTGKAKENRYNARKSLSELVTVNISKANCRQRQGRAGRVREGYCFRLFTEAQFETFDDHQLCEMHRVPLESLILQIYALHLGDEVDYLQKALTPPEERAIHSSVKVLTTLGALTAEKRLTSLGQHLANLPLDVRVGKMIIHGALLHCVDPVLTMAACLATRSPFLASPDLKSEVENMRRAFAGESLSDQLSSWFAYNRWASTLAQKGAAAARKVCQECYLSPATLLQIQSTKRQYERYLCEASFIEGGGHAPAHRFVFPPYSTLDDRVFEAGGELFNSNSTSSQCILACLVAGLYPNIAKRRANRGLPHSSSGPARNGARFVTFDGSDCLVHPSSVAGKTTSFASPLLAYVDKIKTSATFLREVSVVMPLHVILFGSGQLEYLTKYEELCVDEITAFKCRQEDATLLIHLKTQLDSALTQKINEPSKSWESISSVVVRAIVKLMRDDGGKGRHLTIVDRRQPRVPLTEPLLPVATDTASPSPGPVPENQPFKTNKSCFHCGEAGHVSRFCPHNSTTGGGSGGGPRRGGPPIRCFICGQWHFPQDCTIVQPLRR